QSQITHSLSLVTHSLDAPRLLGHPLPHPAPPRRGNWAMAMSMSAATRAMRRIHARRTSASCLLRSARPDPNPAVLQGQAPVPRWYWGAAAGADPPSTQAHLGVATVPQRQVKPSEVKMKIDMSATCPPSAMRAHADTGLARLSTRRILAGN
uniref:Uncharacterized protein n=1 Tax=Aegilops tauschii subsp. strangulata TaxID=200361 RepID=A0A452YA22_AEGTS